MKRIGFLVVASALTGACAVRAEPTEQDTPLIEEQASCAQSENFPLAEAIAGLCLFSFFGGVAWERWFLSPTRNAR